MVTELILETRCNSQLLSPSVLHFSTENRFFSKMGRGWVTARQQSLHTSCGRPCREAVAVSVSDMQPRCLPCGCTRGVRGHCSSSIVSEVPCSSTWGCACTTGQHRGSRHAGLLPGSCTQYLRQCLLGPLVKWMRAALLFLNKLSTLFNIKINVKFVKQATLVAVHASIPLKPYNSFPV